VREWIRANEVCWEITPHYEVHEHAPRQAGFDLRLFARRPAACTSDPGCPACAETHEQLRQIALAVLPDGVRYAIEPFDAAFHLRPENRWQPELDLVVEVLAGGTSQTGDHSDRDHTRAVAEALSRRGARARVWHEAR
jgi:hypothetical protein